MLHISFLSTEALRELISSPSPLVVSLLVGGQGVFTEGWAYVKEPLSTRTLLCSEGRSHVLRLPMLGSVQETHGMGQSIMPNQEER